jgi:hypothetical protein
MLEEVTTVQIKRKTRDRLERYGTRHESYDAIMKKVLDELESKRIGKK